MTAASLAAHADAVLTLLRAIPALTGRVFPEPDGGAQTVPNNTAPPYVTAHVAARRPEDGRLTGRSTRMQLRIYVHCSGSNDDAARLVSDWVAGALLDVKPVIAGRTSYPIRHESDQPPRPDESTGRTVSTLTEVYALQTDAGR